MPLPSRAMTTNSHSKTYAMKFLLQSLLATLMLAATVGEPAVAEVLINTNTTDIASRLDLDGEGNASTHIVKVADLTIATENPQGLTLTMSSGELLHPAGEPIAFQIVTVPDGASPPGTGEFTVGFGDNYSFSTTRAGTQERDIYIQYTPMPLQDPGTYRASIHLTVVEN